MEFIEQIENLIDKLVENEYGIIVKKNVLRGVISTDIIIPHETFPKELTEEEIVFRLIIDTFSLKISPKLYCLTPYCFPHLADGRDLYKELRNSKNSNQGLSFDNLLVDILEFIKINFERGGLIFCGNYYLGSKYDLRILQKGCENIINVKENLVVNGKKVKFNRVLILSDVYFLLFEQEKWYKNNLTLLFWSSINNIEKIQKVKDNKTIILHWTQKNKETPYLMNLTITQRESFINDLLEKMKTFGMNFDIMKINKDNKIEHDIFSSTSKLHSNLNYEKKINQINNINDPDDNENEEEEEEDEHEGDNEEEGNKNNKKKINKENNNNDNKEEKKRDIENEENKKVNNQNLLDFEIDSKNKEDINKEEKKIDEEEIKVDINIGKEERKNDE